VKNVRTVIADRLRFRECSSQSELDRAMIDLDGTADKSRLGANAILSVSIAFARACAVERGISLYQYFSECCVKPQPARCPDSPSTFLVAETCGWAGADPGCTACSALRKTIDESLSHVYAVYQSAARLCLEKYNTRPLTADEGGLAPPFPDVDAMIGDAIESIRRAGFAPGKEIALAVDVASSHFYREGKYHLGTGGTDFALTR
jgi:enolase